METHGDGGETHDSIGAMGQFGGVGGAQDHGVAQCRCSMMLLNELLYRWLLNGVAHDNGVAQWRCSMSCSMVVAL